MCVDVRVSFVFCLYAALCLAQASAGHKNQNLFKKENLIYKDLRVLGVPQGSPWGYPWGTAGYPGVPPGYGPPWTSIFWTLGAHLHGLRFWFFSKAPLLLMGCSFVYGVVLLVPSRFRRPLSLSSLMHIRRITCVCNFALVAKHSISRCHMCKQGFHSFVGVT